MSEAGINYILQNIRFDEINFTDTSYKFSRNPDSDKLIKSISRNGILAPPVLLHTSSYFTIIVGHNRLFFAQQCGLQSCDCLILHNLEVDTLIHYALMKAFNGEIGPVGKIKFVTAVQQLSQERTEEIKRIALHDMGIPEYFLSSLEEMYKISALPKMLKNYLDLRDPGFKTLRDLIRLPKKVLDIVNSWIEHTQMRVNIFRDSIDYLYDIHRRGGSLLPVEKINPVDIEDNRAREQYIYLRLRELRFPEYSMMMESADSIINNFRKKGVTIQFPNHFEGDIIRIALELSKKEGLESFQKQVNTLDYKKLKTLLELL